MSELKNTFSWSISAREDFNECRRRRYWAKYAMWNGWKENASPIQRTAYRLTKMENRFSLTGNAVELAVNWMIARQQAGEKTSVDEAYTAAAKPFLNQRWDESHKGLWKTNPKKYCCLREHYYREFVKKDEKEMTVEMIAQVKLCLTNFIAKVLPALAPVKKEQEIAINTPEKGGDPESFLFQEAQASHASPWQVKIYAIPDYAYLKDGIMHIHDWKSGSAREKHNDQMAVYGLWAAVKHKFAPEKVNVHLEYLSAGLTVSQVLKEENLTRAQELIGESVSEIAEYLVDGNMARNEPLPKEDWEMSAEMNVCRQCNFYELCKPELEA
jgi:hypothetical protein